MPSGRRLRIVLAIADARPETALHAVLEAGGCDVIRCLSCCELLDRLRAGGVDAALVAATLYQLTPARWATLVDTGVPLVLRADGAEGERWPGWGAVIDSTADVDELRRALLLAAGRKPAVAAPPPQPLLPREDVPASARATGHERGRILAVGGGPGAGRTTVAANLALALGLASPTVLVDADLGCSCTGPALGADITRHLAALAHADPRSPAEWDRALVRDGQPLHSRCPHGVLLCGLPRPESRGALSAGFFERLLAELRSRYAHVVLDVGCDLLSPDVAVHRTALQAADDVLLVARADPLGLWEARSVLGLWERQLRLPAGRAALAVNQHDARRHQRPAAIGWALGAPIAAVLPQDRAAIERAVAERSPLLFDRRSRLAAALLAFADRVHGGRILLPTAAAPPRSRWERILAHLPRRRLTTAKGAASHGNDTVPVA